VSDETALSPTFGAHTIKVFRAMKPFLDYLNMILK